MASMLKKPWIITTIKQNGANPMTQITSGRNLAQILEVDRSASSAEGEYIIISDKFNTIRAFITKDAIKEFQSNQPSALSPFAKVRGMLVKISNYSIIKHEKSGFQFRINELGFVSLDRHNFGAPPIDVNIQMEREEKLKRTENEISFQLLEESAVLVPPDQQKELDAYFAPDEILETQKDDQEPNSGNIEIIPDQPVESTEEIEEQKEFVKSVAADDEIILNIKKTPKKLFSTIESEEEEISTDEYTEEPKKTPSKAPIEIQETTVTSLYEEIPVTNDDDDENECFAFKNIQQNKTPIDITPFQKVQESEQSIEKVPLQNLSSTELEKTDDVPTIYQEQPSLDSSNPQTFLSVSQEDQNKSEEVDVLQKEKNVKRSLDDTMKGDLPKKETTRDEKNQQSENNQESNEPNIQKKNTECMISNEESIPETPDEILNINPDNKSLPESTKQSSVDESTEHSIQRDEDLIKLLETTPESHKTQKTEKTPQSESSFIDKLHTQAEKTQFDDELDIPSDNEEKHLNEPLTLEIERMELYKDERTTIDESPENKKIEVTPTQKNEEEERTVIDESEEEEETLQSSKNKKEEMIKTSKRRREEEESEKSMDEEDLLDEQPKKIPRIEPQIIEIEDHDEPNEIEITCAQQKVDEEVNQPKELKKNESLDKKVEEEQEGQEEEIQKKSKQVKETSMEEKPKQKQTIKSVSSRQEEKKVTKEITKNVKKKIEKRKEKSVIQKSKKRGIIENEKIHKVEREGEKEYRKSTTQKTSTTQSSKNERLVVKEKSNKSEQKGEQKRIEKKPSKAETSKHQKRKREERNVPKKKKKVEPKKNITNDKVDFASWWKFMVGPKKKCK